MSTEMIILILKWQIELVWLINKAKANAVFSI